jgi:hypothetical protein
MNTERWCKYVCVGLGVVLAVGGLGGGTGSAASTARPSTENGDRQRRHTRAVELGGRLDHSEVRKLPFAARDVAVHWTRSSRARVSISFSTDGLRFTRPIDAGRDPVGEGRGDGETYGALLDAHGATAIGVTTDRPLDRLSVLALRDEPASAPAPRADAQAGDVAPTIITRAGWQANESWRFDANHNEVWPEQFFPLQKLVVHHTASRNNDPDPAATVRSTYYYQAITQGWGDIGYSFLIDEAGRIYEGRHADDTVASPPGENGAGEVVTAGHALGVNQASLGVTFLGTLTTQDATPAAKSALEDLLAWEVARHGIDPHGITLYQDPDGVTSSYTPRQPIPNILGHRDVSATECPGGAFYATLPGVRDAVAARITPLLGVATSSLADATVGAPYSQGLEASGGQSPYSWSLAADSTSLPPGLGLSTSGQISGTATTAGTYSFRVQVADGANPVHTAVRDLSITVMDVPDFTLVVSPASRTVTRGSSVDYTVTIGRSGGFTGAVTLAVNCPTGATCGWSSNPTTGSSVRLSVRTRRATPRTTYGLTVTGTSAPPPLTRSASEVNLLVR